MMSGCEQFSLALALCIGFSPLSNADIKAQGKAQIQKRSFGKSSDQKPVDLYTLTNNHGVEVQIMTYGGAIVALKVPDRRGKIEDVVLGYDNLEGYLKQNPH